MKVEPVFNIKYTSAPRRALVPLQVGVDTQKKKPDKLSGIIRRKNKTKVKPL